MNWLAVSCITALLSFQYSVGHGMFTGGVSRLGPQHFKEYSDLIFPALQESVDCGNSRATFNVLCGTKQVVAGSLVKIEGLASCGDNLKKCTFSIWTRLWLKKNRFQVEHSCENESDKECTLVTSSDIEA